MLNNCCKLKVEELEAWYYSRQVLKGISMEIRANRITAVIGPSGCGKSTLIRCLNRMHEIVPGARVSGRVILDGQDIYRANPVEVRRRIGMVFQVPNVFPSMSVFENVAVGLSLNGMRSKEKLREVVENCLFQVGLMDEIGSRLYRSATGLSSGQLQRVCIARALAVQPEVLLMDEPCSALDPIASFHIEELMSELKQKYTIILVTHNMQQAARISDYTAFLTHGILVEYGSTPAVFINPRDRRTENYITGRSA